MTVIICIDNAGGMLFNNRRVSRDRAVVSDILKLTDGKILMSPYSKILFEGFDDRIVVDNNFLEKASENDFCFVETIDVSPFESKINRIILYKWNRDYPSDFKFTLKLDGCKLTRSTDFQGFSHDKITKEIFVKDI